MRRFFLLLILLLSPVAGRLDAQIKAEVTITLDSTGKMPVVQLLRLFEVKEWREAIQQGVAVTVQWKLILWRKGFLWNSQVQKQEWKDIVRRQVLLDQYDIRQLFPDRGLTQPEYFRSLDELAFARFTQPLPLVLRLPDKSGSYYYSIEVEIETRSGEEIERKLRFVSPNENLWVTLTRPISNVFLPARKLPTATTATFTLTEK